LQIEAVRWRASLAGCTVTVYQHLDGSISLTHGLHRLGRYSAQGQTWAADKKSVDGLWKRRDAKLYRKEHPYGH
jgi:hypothetical protein